MAKRYTYITIKLVSIYSWNICLRSHPSKTCETMVAYVFTGMVHIFTTNLKMPVYWKEKYIFVERERFAQN